MNLTHFINVAMATGGAIAPSKGTPAVDWLTVGADVATMATGVSVMGTAVVWLGRRGHRWWVGRRHMLGPGQSLRVGRSLYSPDGRTRFTLQADANMVVIVDGYGVFTDTATIGLGKPKHLKLEEDDGRLVLYDVDQNPIWETEPGGVRLEVQDNAHVVLYNASDKAIWATDWLLMRGKPVRHHLPEPEPPAHRRLGKLRDLRTWLRRYVARAKLPRSPRRPAFGSQ